MKQFDRSAVWCRGYYTTTYNNSAGGAVSSCLDAAVQCIDNLPAEPADGDTCLHGKMVLIQYYELKPGSLMLFQRSKFGVSLYLSSYNYGQQKLLMNIFSEDRNQAIKTCNFQLEFQKVRSERLVSSYS